MTDFIIITTQRSGSNMLASALNSHPRLQCLGEPGRKTTPLEPTRGDVRGMINMCSMWERSGKLIHAERYIHLMRNPHDTALSDLAMQHGYGHHYTEPVDRVCHILTDNLETEKARVESDHRYIDGVMLGGGYDALIVNYEDLVRDSVSMTHIPESEGRRITEFLGVNYAPMTTKLVKPGTVYVTKED